MSPSPSRVQSRSRSHTQSQSTRQTVNPEKYTELNEYAALLRALKTHETLDISSQITKAVVGVPQPLQEDERLYEDDEDHLSELESVASGGQLGLRDIPANDREFEGSPTSSPIGTATPHSSGALPHAAPHQIPKSKNTTVKSFSTTTWTRWPHMPAELRQPEWQIPDEVWKIVKQTVSTHPRFNHSIRPPTEDSNKNDEEYQDEPHIRLEEIPELQSMTRAILYEATHNLVRMLSVIEAVMPDAYKNNGGRLKAMSWESVLDVVGASRVVDRSVVDSVRENMLSYFDREAVDIAAPAFPSEEPDIEDVDEEDDDIQLLEVEPLQDLLKIPETSLLEQILEMPNIPDSENTGKKRKYTFRKRQPAEKPRNRKRRLKTTTLLTDKP